MLTLVGTRLARAGTEFVYRGPAPGCDGCPYRKQCLNLEAGMWYEITDVREGGQVLDCAVHDDGVLAVEVERTSFEANVPSKGAYAGSRVAMAGECSYSDCPSHHLCEPLGVDPEGEFQIVEVLGEPPHEHCGLDRNLRKVELAPPDS